MESKIDVAVVVVVAGVLSAVQLKPSEDWKNATWYVVALTTVYRARSQPTWLLANETALLLVAVTVEFVPSDEALNESAPDDASDILYDLCPAAPHFAASVAPADGVQDGAASLILMSNDPLGDVPAVSGVLSRFDATPGR